MLPKATTVAPVKFVPVIVTAVPTGPLPGREAADGRGRVTVKLLVLVGVPPAVVTVIGPLFAAGRHGRRDLGRRVDAEADSSRRPLKATTVAPVKFVPVIVTAVATGPLVGVKPLIVGAR